jgi:uroporphyrinogen-III decarboxylase
MGRQRTKRKSKSYQGKRLPQAAKQNPLLNKVREAHKRGKFIPLPLYSYGEIERGLHTKDVLAKPEHIAGSALRGMKRYGLQHALVPMDLTLEQELVAHRGGHTVREYPKDGRGPASVRPESHPVHKVGDRLPELGASLKETPIEPFIKAQEHMKLSDPEALRFGYIAGPITGATSLGDSNMVMMAVMGPEAVGEEGYRNFGHWMDYSERLGKRHGRILAKNGAGVMMLDPMASGMFSPKDFKEKMMPPARRVINEIHKNGGYTVYHVCGDTNDRIREMCETGASAIQIDTDVDLDKALETVKRFNDEHPKRPPVLVLGNFNGKNMDSMSTQEVRKRTREMLRVGDKYDFFVPSTGCEIPHNVPPENIHAFVDAIKRYKRKAA